MKWILAVLALGLSITTMNAYGIVQSNDGTPEDDTIDGEFTSSGYNNPTEVTHFEFKEIDDTNSISGSNIISGASLTPQKKYYVKLEIYDRETIADVTRVAISFFDNTDYSDGDSFRGQSIPNRTTNGKEMVFGWDRGNPITSQGAIGMYKANLEGLDALTSASLSYEIISSTAPAVGVNEQVTEAAFEFIFKISRVAREGINNWQFGYYIQDGVNNTTLSAVTNPGITPGSNPDSGRSTYSMQWYGEINVPTTISWAGITPGVNFNDSASVVTGAGFKYYVNGGFEIAARISNQWTPSATRVANVQPAQLTEAAIIDQSNPPQAFAMKIITQGAAGNNESSQVSFDPKPSDSNDLSEEVVIQRTPDPEATGVGFFAEQGFGNTASGDGKIDGYTFYLKTSTDLQNATYSGEIKFTLRND